MSETIGRFAPTPSGRMHLGNLFCALLAWLAVRTQDGRLILRIEDLDPGRTSREAALQIERDLLELGLDWDEGGSRGGPHGPYEQSRRGGLYEAALGALEEKGLLYPCFCTRAQLHAADAPHASDGEPIYSGRCARLTGEQALQLSQGRSPALRIRTPDEVVSFVDGCLGPYAQNLARDCGDFILRRSDGVFAYQLAVVADDADMGVTQVVRGGDLLSSTPRQLYLYRLLGKRPPAFYHVPVLLGKEGRRLSKRDRDLGLDALRKRGFTPWQIIGQLAFAAGLIDRPQAVSPKELVGEFSWEKIPRHNIRLTIE